MWWLGFRLCFVVDCDWIVLLFVLGFGVFCCFELGCFGFVVGWV